MSVRQRTRQMDLGQLTKMYDLSGRSVVITGGTGILGRAMVQALIGCGANVAVLARSKEKADSLLSAMSGPGAAIAVQGDVLQRDTLQQAAQAVMAEFGGIDALINAAGGNQLQATIRPDLS